jgi:CheY-like chemotaxis protein
MAENPATILLVEDNEALLFNTRMKLEMSGYNVLSATNGQEALDLMHARNELPDLIVSDIMMPIMDGYQFYHAISENRLWNQIPFIFLTAKSSPEDIRLGKKLGVDDYIIKPFSGEDLLASIEGRLAKKTRNKNMQQQYESSLATIETPKKEPKSAETQNIILFWIDWDESVGPIVRGSIPGESDCTIPIEEIGVRLYNTSMAIYDTKDWNSSSGAFFHINYLDMDAVLMFASIDDPKVRGGQRLFMIVVLANTIHYLESSRIQEKLKEAAESIKKSNKFLINEYWTQIKELLS